MRPAVSRQRVMAILGVAVVLVWLRGRSELVAQIGPVQASGGAHADDGQLWIADHFEKPEGWRAVLYRVSLRGLM